VQNPRLVKEHFTIKPHPAFFRKDFSLTVNIFVLSTHRANLPVLKLIFGETAADSTMTYLDVIERQKFLEDVIK
jgi:hypothetical protein